MNYTSILNEISNVDVNSDHDKIANTTKYEIVCKGHLLADIVIHNVEVPEITTRMFGNDDLTVYKSVDSQKNAEKYMKALAEDIKNVQTDGTYHYSKCYLLSFNVRNYILDIKFDGPLKILGKAPLFMKVMTVKTFVVQG